MNTKIIEVCPVLPSQDILRDTKWYENQAGFEVLFQDKMYALIKRDDLCLHLQWHADNEDDPLLGGSVIRIIVDKLMPIFNEFVERGTVKKEKLALNTAWGTNEFGFYDLNKNAVFIVERV